MMPSVQTLTVHRLNAQRETFGPNRTVGQGRVRLLFGPHAGRVADVLAHDAITDVLTVAVAPNAPRVVE